MLQWVDHSWGVFFLGLAIGVAFATITHRFK